jgi:thiol-disulfide isomerase/thioredoxin
MDATASPSAPHARSGIGLWVCLALVAAVFFVFLLVGGRPRGPSATEGPAIGRTLPYLQLEGLTGDSKPVSLDDLQGRITLINYWGTWCPPCQREFPHIVELAEKFAGQDDFRLYAVSCGQQVADENPNDLRRATQRFLESNQVTLPAYADQNRASRHAMTVALDLEDFAYPTTLVLDRQGKVRGLWIGYAPGSEREMRSLIQDLLEKPAPQPAA